jgi:hypothetical protein
MLRALLNWLRPRVARLERRWIPHPAERADHEAIVRERLIEVPGDVDSYRGAAAERPQASG